MFNKIITNYKHLIKISIIINIALIVAGLSILLPKNVSAILNINLNGRILLQVQSHGEAWYLNPVDQKRYYLGRPQNALDLMKKTGIGISDNDLKKIPIGLVDITSQDTDNDGLSDDLEKAIGTDLSQEDSDGDGYNDSKEIMNNYDPLGAGKINIDSNLVGANLGKIFLQIEKQGQAWYVNPQDKKRYFLNRPTDTLNVMRQLGLGITNDDLNQIPVGYIEAENIAQTDNGVMENQDNSQAAISTSSISTCQPDSDVNKVLTAVASAVRNNNIQAVVDCSDTRLKKSIEYTMKYLDDNGRSNLANMIANSKLTSSTDSKQVFSENVYFPISDYEMPFKFTANNISINFTFTKQSDGKWMLADIK